MGHHGPGRIGDVMMADKTRMHPSGQLLRVLWRYLRASKLALIVVSVIIIFYVILATLTPVVIQQAIDILALGPSIDTIQLSIILFIILSISMWFFDSLNLWISAGIKARMVHDIRQETFNHLVDSDMSYHHTHQSGNITSRVIGDTEEVANGISVFTNFSSQILLIGTTFLVLLIINWVFALIALLAIPVAFVIIWIFSGVGKRRMLKVRQAIGHVSAKLAEALAGVAISKSFNQEKQTSKEIKQLNEQSYQHMVKLGVIFSLIMPAVTMISIILVAMVLIAGGFLGTSVITIGTIFLGTIMVQKFLGPVIHMGMFVTQLQASLAALDRIVDVQEAQPAITNASDAKPLDLSDPSITLDNVSFSYLPQEWVLKHVNIQIQAGEKVALVGHTGAGKTTISSLLMRFYDPVHGSIRIGNQDLKDITLESLLQAVSLVPQEPYLFADTVLENIRYGKPEASDQQIYDLCLLLGADQFIEALPNGYQTILQESGKSLSAGQRQMITIARTMLSDPKILLLDEATSRLDAYSESLVQQAQNILFKGRTTLVIAHRLSTIQDVDKIIVLEQGEVLEQGTNEELLEAKGKYFELYQTYYAHQGVSVIEEPVQEIVEFQQPDRMKAMMAKEEMMQKKKKAHSMH